MQHKIFIALLLISTFGVTLRAQHQALPQQLAQIVPLPDPFLTIQQSSPTDGDDNIARHSQPASSNAAQKTAAITVLETPGWSLHFNWDTNLQVWDTTFQTLYTYTPGGIITSLTYSNYVSGAFVRYSRTTVTLDSLGLLAQAFHHLWDGTQWVDNGRIQYSYDQFENLIGRVNEQWNGVSWDTIFPTYRRSLTYVLGDQIATSETQYFDSTLHVFINGHREDYTYNADSLVASKWSYQWMTNAWVPRDMNEYSYNVNDELDTTIQRSFYNGGWNQRKLYWWQSWHNAAQNLPGDYELEDSSGSQVTRYRFHNMYGLNDSRVEYMESFNGATWDSVALSIFDYDAQAHLRLRRYHYYDNGNFVPTSGGRFHYTYDGLNRTLEYWSEFHSLNDTTYVPDYRVIYGDFFEPVATIASAEVSVAAFPNPCHDRVHFQLPASWSGTMTLAIHDLTGRQCKSETRPITPGELLTVPIDPTWADGVYLCRLACHGHEITCRLIVAR